MGKELFRMYVTNALGFVHGCNEGCVSDGGHVCKPEKPTTL